MKKLATVLVSSLMICASAFAQEKAPATTLSATLDRHLSQIEAEFVPAAEALPDGKFDFAPSASGGEFKGVRTFAQEVKHVAATNYMLGAAILGEKPPLDLGKGENGPDTVKSKADVDKFLKDSFAYLHKALASINDQNAYAPIAAPWGSNKTTRASLALIAVEHPWDHYGQMVEYLRMNGIVPPASRG